MADEPQTIRSIHWRELFPFLHLFRAFRIAVHPSKLVLGLLALLTLYTGGRVLDGVWPNAAKPVYGELDRYEAHANTRNPTESFEQRIDGVRRENTEDYARALRQAGLVTDPNPDAATNKSLDAARRLDHYGDLRERIFWERNRRVEDARKAREDRDKAIDADTKLDDAGKRREHAKTRDEYEIAVRQAHEFARREVGRFRQAVPRGVFDEFFTYEARQINSVVWGVMQNNWTRGAAAAAEVRQEDRRAAVAGAGADDTDGAVEGTGVFPAVWNFFVTGPAWLVRYHPVYATLFTLLFLLVWAVFGGAIARIAAVHVARDEKISVRQALRFSISKVLSFVFAPVIPLLIVLGIGVLLSAGGLLFYVPVIGPIVAGLLFFLALIGGVVITLVLFGTIGGLNLMYPTVAVEGSDSFDAISRSFSYVFARPWRMLFYTALAIAYGALTYLFVKFFLYVVLAVTHFFVGWWLFGQPGRWYPEIWPGPRFESLPYDIAFGGLKWSEDVAAFCIAFWVFLTIGLLGAFAISFYFSVNTIIYYLMRREVDATELDDVYVEEVDDDLADTGPVTAAGGQGAAGGATGGGGTGGGMPASAATDPSGLPVTSTTRATGMGESLPGGAPAAGSTSAPGGGVTDTAGSSPPGGSADGGAQAYTSPATDNPGGNPHQGT